ncbi:hypothetical protein GCM10022234_29920 [Aeromicrobium panaciterrae]|uniref:choice-of-anchor P family protein n=1 Tax=Aeromicrobium panaciterrae TaxID=363861 RepID=UPI0031E35264
MSRRPLAAVAATLTALATTLTLTTVANAAEPDPTTPYAYNTKAGGTYANALNGTVVSDLTSQSGISGEVYPNSNSNTIASAKVGGLATVDAVKTEVNATKEGDVTTTTANAETGKATLLNGLIKLDAIKTVTQAKRDGVALSGKSSSEILGLIINGKKIGANPSNNFGVKIYGVAEIVLNEQKVDIQGPSVTVTGSALKVTLLKAYAGSPAGTTIVVNPTSAILAPRGPSTGNLGLGGYARGTYATINAGDTVTAVTGPTAYVATPPGGTFGYDLTNSTAAVNVPMILSLAAVSSTANGVTSPTAAEITHTNNIGKVNILNGLIKADAVKVSAKSEKFANGDRAQTPHTDIVGLYINGKKILTLDFKPNTVIEVPGVARIVINEQAKDARANTVTALHVTLLKPRSGLKVGAEIYVGIAGSIVF